MDDNQMNVDVPADFQMSSEMDRSSVLDQSSLLNIDSSSHSNHSIESISSSSSSSVQSTQEQVDCMIVDENLKTNDPNCDVSINNSNVSNGKSKSKKRSKAEIEQEKQERAARKAKEAEEKRIRREERERKAELSRQKKEEKKKEIEENKRLREQKRVEKEKELEERKRIVDEQKRISDQKKAEREAEKELKKQEKKRLDEEKSRKEMLVKTKFTSFFQKVSPEQKKKTKIGNLELQKDQSIANYIPEISKDNFVMGAFDSQVIHQDATVLYLHELRNRSHMPYMHAKHSKTQMKTDDEITDGSQGESKTYRAKLLQFHENLRPAYFGTWRKKSAHITGRRPFGREMELFDYEIDSDLEWEEEEEGEIIKDDESEKDKLEDEEEEDQEGDDYELDDFFVPHGHLSDDENQDDEHCEVIEEPNGQKKRKLLTKEKILIEERTKKLKKLIPKCSGCLFMTNDEFENKAKFQTFEKYRVCFVN